MPDVFNNVTAAPSTISNLKWLAIAVLGIVLAVGIGFGAWYLIAHQKKAVENHGADVVQGIEANSAQDVANVAQEKIIEHYTYYNQVDKEVEHDLQEVDNVSDPTEVMDPDIDAAGRSALCRLRDGGCVGAEAAPLHGERGPVPQSN